MFKDFLLFRRMLTPLFIQIFFWIGVIACIISGIVNMAHSQWLDGLQILILGPIMVRVVCEFFILFFRMNGTLTGIKNSLENKTEKH